MLVIEGTGKMRKVNGNQTNAQWRQKNRNSKLRWEN